MKIEQLAAQVIDAREKEKVDHMVTGAFAVGFYGIPRSTKDFDLVIRIETPETVTKVISRLEPEIIFNSQVEFDTLTWGRRHVAPPEHDRHSASSCPNCSMIPLRSSNSGAAATPCNQSHPPRKSGFSFPPSLRH